MVDHHFADFPELAQESVRIWDELADWWDDAIGQGNKTQDLLVEPTQERLLTIEPGDLVLDVACGAGRFTRRLAAAGARVVAFDQSARFVERARAATPAELAGSVEYHVVDVADTAALARLGPRRFKAAVCTMALMDIASLTPLLASLRELLVPGGAFVFSVTHPVFNSGDAHLVGEEVLRDRTIEVVVSSRVTDYLTPRPQQDVGISGQPVRSYTFHRPLSVLLNACFDSGFVLDRLEEPGFPPRPEGGKERKRVSWSNVTKLPQVLVARLRLAE